MADDGSADAGDWAIFCVSEHAGVRENEGDVATSGDWRGQSDQDIERIHRIAAKTEGLAVGCGYRADDEIGMQLDAKIAGNGRCREFNFRYGANRLAGGVERGGDIVVVREETDLLGNLGAERRDAAGQRDDERQCKQNANSSAEGHRILQWAPFAGV